MSTILYETNTTFGGTLATPGGGSPGPGTGAVYLDATQHGPPGSTAVPISASAGLNNQGMIYFVSDASLNNQSFAAGTWTVGLQTTMPWSGGPYSVVALDLFIYTSGSPYTYKSILGSLAPNTTLASGNTYSWNITGSAATFGPNDVLVVGFALTNSGLGGNLYFIPSQAVSFVANVQAFSPVAGTTSLVGNPGQALGAMALAPVSGTATLSAAASLLMQGGAALIAGAATFKGSPAALVLTGTVNMLPIAGNATLDAQSPTLFSLQSQVNYLLAGTASLSGSAPGLLQAGGGLAAGSAQLGGNPAQVSAASGSTQNYVPVADGFQLAGSPVNSSLPHTFHYFMRRGNVQNMPSGLPEGVPYEPGIPTGSGTFEMLFLGGHAGEGNKIVGGGFQTTSGEPSWTPPTDGTWVPAVVDSTNKKLWLYIGGAWVSAIFS